MAARAYTSGRLSRSQRILGPTDCEVRALPQASMMACLAESLVEGHDLGAGARVHPVQDGVHERLAAGVDGQHAGADGARGHGVDGPRVQP